MVYYKDYRLTIIETDGKYTLYDAKYGGRAVHQNKTKEWTDSYICEKVADDTYIEVAV